MSVEVTSPPSTTPELRDHRSLLLARELAAAVDRHDAEGEQRVRAALVEVNMPVAEALASRYRSRGAPEEDLRQVAYLGLVQASRRFDPALGTTFVAFCVPTVLGEVKRHFRDRGWVVRPPRRVQELQLRLFGLRRDLTASLGRPPGVDELADEAGCTPEDVLEAFAVRSCYSPSSLDRRLGPEDDSQTIGDLLPALEADLGPAEARVLLGPSVSQLDERDRQILRLRFFDDLTQREIAAEVGVTQMQVSRVLTRIFEELRASIGDRT